MKRQRPNLKAAVAHGLERMRMGVDGYTDMIPPRLLHDLDRTRNLTQRELAVMFLTAEGFYSKEAARMLGISVNTVNVHVQHALRKLGANNKPHGVAICLRQGLFY